jgi:Fe-S cluster biosynthesis and repair protein YggX
MGQQVLKNVCQTCWAEWRETSAQLINHYGLVMGDPRTRAEMRRVMREFLNLEED